MGCEEEEEGFVDLAMSETREVEFYGTRCREREKEQGQECEKSMRCVSLYATGTRASRENISLSASLARSHALLKADINTLLY